MNISKTMAKQIPYPILTEASHIKYDYINCNYVSIRVYINTITYSHFFRILANRITELEKTLESWCNGQKYIPIFPSEMLLDEFLTDSEKSVQSNESKEKEQFHENDEHNRCKYSDSDDELNKENSDGSSADIRHSYGDDDDGQQNGENQSMSKTVLPLELEELVKEALAQLKMSELN